MSVAALPHTNSDRQSGFVAAFLSRHGWAHAFSLDAIWSSAMSNL